MRLVFLTVGGASFVKRTVKMAKGASAPKSAATDGPLNRRGKRGIIPINAGNMTRAVACVSRAIVKKSHTKIRGVFLLVSRKWLKNRKARRAKNGRRA